MIELVTNTLPDLLPMRHRSPGLHVSSIIHDLCVNHLHHYKPSTADRNTTRMQLGCALEDSIAARFAAQYPNRYIQLGEAIIDGIPGTSDLYDLDLDEPTEIKLTWMSSRHDPLSDKFWRYWTQVGCYAQQTDSLTTGLIVVHVNGDYKSNEVIANHWRRHWTATERQKNWDMIRRHRDRMLSSSQSER